MLRASRLVRRAEMAGRIAIDTITLDREARWRRRVALETDRGHAFLLDLAEATYLADGDALEIEGRGLVRVVAAPEDLIEVHAPDAVARARIAWHIGNRHTPAEITGSAIYIQPDHVLEEMVAGLGGHVHHVRRPFEPEGGAYGHKGALQTGHGHGPHGHRRDHGHHHHHEHGQQGDGHSHGLHGGHSEHGEPASAPRVDANRDRSGDAHPKVWRPE